MVMCVIVMIIFIKFGTRELTDQTIVLCDAKIGHMATLVVKPVQSKNSAAEGNNVSQVFLSRVFCSH